MAIRCAFKPFGWGSNERNGARGGAAGNHSGRSSHESSKAVQHLFFIRCRSRQVFGLPGAPMLIGSYCMPLPKPPFQGFSANGIVRSQLPLRGSSGIAPDSLLGLALVPGTAIDHKILCFYDGVNDIAADLMACYYIQYPCFRSSSNERSRHLSPCSCRVVLAHV